MRQFAVAILMLLLAACAAAPAPSAPEPAATAPAPASPEPAATAADTPADPLALDRSCKVDSDCEVKNVGNCCGYYPACVNRGAQPDPEAVRARCAESGMASTCGFPQISACSCVANRCEALDQPLQPASE